MAFIRFERKRERMPISANLTKFLALCVVWGLTWIATKVGIEAVPPLLFAGTRFAAAGLLLSLWACQTLRFADWRLADLGRLIGASVLMIVLCYGPLFWGMQYVSSGTAAVLEMSLTPIALLGFGILLQQERWSWTNALSMGLGVAGLSILFAPSIKASDISGGSSMLGILAVAWAAISYAWGSVVARPLIERFGSTALSGATMLIGGCTLLVSSLVLEPRAALAFTVFWGWPAAMGWLFLFLFGSLVGYSLYMQLLRDIGPAKAGSFAFVSPAIAVVTGVIAKGEVASALDVVGMAVMLLAAGLSLYSAKVQAVVSRRLGSRSTAIANARTSNTQSGGLNHPPGGRR